MATRSSEDVSDRGVRGRGEPSAEPSLRFVEMTPASKTESVAPFSTDVCEIIVAGVALRIGAGVPAKRVAELIRAARLA